MFSRLQGVDPKYFQTGIIVGDRSRNVNISNNKFETHVNVQVNLEARSTRAQIPHDKLKTNFTTSMALNKFERAYKNIEHMERFIYECEVQRVQPMVRTYSLFSHISSVRSRESADEYNSLILAEKSLLDRMMRLKFRMRFIVTLDVPVILTEWGSSLTQATDRITGLYEHVDEVAERYNVEIAVDDINALDNQFILHDQLAIRALGMDPKEKYEYTKYEANPHVINNAIKVYDQRFEDLQRKNVVTAEALGVSAWSEFTEAIVQSRTRSLYERIASL